MTNHRNCSTTHAPARRRVAAPSGRDARRAPIRPAVVHAAALFVLLTASGAVGQEKMAPKITYEDHVKPILRQKCLSCHNADQKKGGLDMTNYTNLMLGGASGAVIEPGDSANSYLYSLITHEDEPSMPPESPKLPDEMLETFRKWIDGGVLENAGSKALGPDKPKFDLALSTTPTERPAVAPMPARLSLEPIVHTPEEAAVTALATNPWSPLAAVAGQKQVLLYNTQTLKLLGRLPFPEGTAQVLKFSRNGALLLAGGGHDGASGRVVVWDVNTGRRVIEVGDELDTVLCADISSDQTLIALGGPQKVVRIYSTESGQLLHELRKHTDWIYSVEFSPDSVLLATGDRNGGLFVWEGWTGREYLTLKAHSDGVTGLSWRGDSNVLASCSEDGSIRLWEMENGGQVKNWNAHGGGVTSVEFARDGRIVSCGRDKVTKLWDQNGQQQQAFEAFDDLALEVTFCDETDRVIAGDWTGAVRIWNAADGKRLGQWTPNPPPLAERARVAGQALAARQAELKPLRDAAAAEQESLDEITARMTEAQQRLAGAEKSAAEWSAAEDRNAKSLADATSRQQDLTKSVATLESASAALDVAAEKAGAASSQLKEDAEIAAATKTIVALAAQRKKELDETRAALDEATKAIETARQGLDEARKKRAEAETVAKETREQVASIAPDVQPAQEKTVAAKQAADQAAAKVSAAQEELERWNSELAFAQQLAGLQDNLAAANERSAQRAQELVTATDAYQAAQAAAEMSRAEHSQAESDAQAAQARLEQETSTLDQATKMLAEATDRREQLANEQTQKAEIVVAVEEALTKTTEAARRAGDDEGLTAAVARIEQTLAARKQSLAETLAAGENLSKSIDDLNKRIAAAKQAVTAADTEWKSATERVATLAQRMEKDAETATAEKAKLDAVASSVEEAERQTAEVRDQIAALRSE